MAGRYFVTGLPRSRTAWFSVACTTPTSVCCHEPTAHLQSFEELCAFWAPKFGVDIGISDSCLAPMLPQILSVLQPRTLIVERPLSDVVQSFRAYAVSAGLPVNEAHIQGYAEAALKAMEQAKTNPLVETVQFDALYDYSTVLEALQWLLPDREFPDLKTLMTFNIQVTARHIQDSMVAPHNGWHLAAL